MCLRASIFKLIAHQKMSRTHAHPAHFSEWISHALAHVRPHIARVRARTHLRNSYPWILAIKNLGNSHHMSDVGDIAYSQVFWHFI